MIRRPDPVAAKNAEIARLQAEVRMWRAKSEHNEAAALQAQSVVADLEEECPECADICALENALNDANRYFLEAQYASKNEWNSCGFWPTKFKCKGLADELCLIQEIVGASVCDSELDVAIAAYNLAYCRAKNAPEYIEDLKCQLIALTESNPDIDPKCLAEINCVIAKYCA